MKNHPRVPLPASVDLFGTERIIQVNHCRSPSCANFRVPARTEHGKPGPSAGRDPAYKLASTIKGSVPSIRCKACNQSPPLKSNACIVGEIERLAAAGGLWRLQETASCRNPECGNHGRSVARHPEAYSRRGRPASGNGRYFQCKACGRRLLVSAPVRLQKAHQSLAADVLSRIANKSPVRGTGRGVRLKSMGSYYPILDFIYGRCRAYSGAVDRALIDGQLRLPKDMVLETDGQDYTLNWTSRLDRRNVVLSGYSSVDSGSRFVLGLHVNLDERVDPFEVAVDAAKCGDFDVAEAFRKYAHYWLPGDELRARRALGRRLHKHDRIELLAQIRSLYANAASREDVEDVEFQLHDDSVHKLPPPGKGMQVHEPYMAYAHWMLLHRMLTGAGVERVQVNMDIDSMSRAGFICAFADEIARGDAHGFYVRYTKFQTVDERKRILREANRARAQYRATLPEDVQGDRAEVARRMMKDRIRAGQSYGKWNDEWIVHPVPTMNEPNKAVSWLTAKDSIDEDRKADMFLNAGLARIDNVFMTTRRLFSALERPIGTSSSHNTVWHGYAPYDPQMLGKYLTIFRAVSNFVQTGDDGRTPAMRLGIERAPLAFEDLLWPGQRIPRPRRSRRKGRVAPVELVTRARRGKPGYVQSGART